MKTTCIATVAILGSASAAPRRMRTSERQLQEDGSLSLPATNDFIPTDLSVPSVEASLSMMSVPSADLLEDEIVVEEVLWASLSIPAIYEEIYGEGSATATVIIASMSMSLSTPTTIVTGGIPEGWTPADEGYVPSETGAGWVAGPDVASDDVTEESESDDVTDVTASASAVSLGVASAAALVGALALF
jgi:hypothetical protein